MGWSLLPPSLGQEAGGGSGYRGEAPIPHRHLLFQKVWAPIKQQGWDPPNPLAAGRRQTENLSHPGPQEAASSPSASSPPSGTEKNQPDFILMPKCSSLTQRPQVFQLCPARLQHLHQPYKLLHSVSQTERKETQEQNSAKGQGEALKRQPLPCTK